MNKKNDLAKVKKELKPINSLKVPKVKLSRTHDYALFDLENISSSKDAYQLLFNIFSEEEIFLKEFFYIVFLNRSNKPLGYYKLSEGGMTGTVADVRIIIQSCLLMGATGLILSHNHPSGNMKPSEADLSLTVRVRRACELLEIVVLDHVILSPKLGDYFSFLDEGLI